VDQNYQRPRYQNYLINLSSATKKGAFNQENLFAFFLRRKRIQWPKEIPSLQICQNFGSQLFPGPTHRKSTSIRALKRLLFPLIAAL